MAWVELVGLALSLWAACGAVIAVGRKLWSIDTTLRVHLLAALVLAFLAAALHRELAPAFDPLLLAPAITIIVMLLDALVVAPLFEAATPCSEASSGRGCRSSRFSLPAGPQVS